MMSWEVISGRLIPYLLTVMASLWTLAFLYAWTNDPGYVSYESMVTPMLQATSEKAQGWGVYLVNVASPTIVISCVCTLLLTNHRFPASRLGWFQKAVSWFRCHPTVPEDASWWVKVLSTCTFTARHVSSSSDYASGITDAAEYGHDLAVKKVNQFGKGEVNANAMAIWLVFLPMSISVLAYIPACITWAETAAIEEGANFTQYLVEVISYTFGWASTLCLVFFLIPVTRHSVLLAAMGWSPIHALRLHIWFGYMSFVFMLVHGIMLVPVWFLYYDYPVVEQIIPNEACWTWTWSHEGHRRKLHENSTDPLHCQHVFYNWTGILAALFFIVLWGSSLNWVRRKNYKWFYTLHVTFGTLTILGIVLHMNYVIVYMIPSLTYYLASTTPTLIQALASRFRGGVKISQAILIEDSGGCVEVQLEANASSRAEIDRNPCQFIKLCVPRISLIWHPFDVYKKYSSDASEHAEDTTVRFLFRPVGPFTKQFAECLVSHQERPVTLVDGFYRGGDKTEQALQHDCVTMIAGGVAVTPYLTFLPALVQALRAENSKTTSIVLHWIVREQGLCDFIVDNYISNIVRNAKQNLKKSVTLAINIYVTGASFPKDSTSLPAPNSDLGLSSNVIAAEVMEEEVTKDPKVMTLEASDSVVDKATDGEDSIEFGGKKEQCNSNGHALELARMLPRRFSNPVWNIPYFIVFTGATFLGFWFIFSQNPDWSELTSYYNLSYMSWTTIYVILMYVAIGLIVEASVLIVRNYWPEPRLDNFDIHTSVVRDKSKQALDAELCAENVTMVYDEGRPTAAQLFKDCRSAAEPGIFMCGPTTLTSMVRSEASKENSLLGLTRFCLYDEPYEM